MKGRLSPFKAGLQGEMYAEPFREHPDRARFRHCEASTGQSKGAQPRNCEMKVAPFSPADLTTGQIWPYGPTNRLKL